MVLGQQLTLRYLSSTLRYGTFPAANVHYGTGPEVNVAVPGQYHISVLAKYLMYGTVLVPCGVMFHSETRRGVKHI